MTSLFHEPANDLFDAAAAGDEKKLAEMLQDPAYVLKITHDHSQTSRKPEGFPPSRPITAAIMHGQLGCMVKIAQATPTAENSVIPTAPDFWGRPPLLWAIAYQKEVMLALLISMGFDPNGVNEGHLKEIPPTQQKNNPLRDAFNAYLTLRQLKRDSLQDYSLKLPEYAESLLELVWDWNEQTNEGFFTYSAAKFEAILPQLATLLVHHSSMQKHDPGLAHFVKLIFQSVVMRMQVSGTFKTLKSRDTYAKIQEIASLSADTLQQVENAAANAKPSVAAAPAPASASFA